MLKKDLTGEQYRLYRLMWSRFVACQMANAVYDSVSVEIDAAGHSFRTSSSSLKFSGYTAVYEEGKDDDKEEKEPTLPPLTEGETLDLKSFGRDQHFTQPPAHYTDATLIRAMEEQGIGRPSTYAPTVSTILDREYVVKEGKYLPHHQSGPGRHAADGGALQRHRRPEIHRQHGEKAGRCGRGHGELEVRAPGFLRRF